MSAADLPVVSFWYCHIDRYRATRLDLRVDLLVEAATLFGVGYHGDALRRVVAGTVNQKIARDILADARSSAWRNYRASAPAERAKWRRCEEVLAELQRAEPIEIRPAPAHIEVSP